MRTRLAVLAGIAMLATGCAMPNVGIVREVKYCSDHGMDAQFNRDNTGQVTDVQCVPKGDPHASK